MHLLPLLALLERGAGSGAEIIFNEQPDEFAFWDRYFRLNGGGEAKPYFNPLTLKRAEKGYPHSNSATIRKNTFALKWHGAQRTVESDGDHWKLASNFADVVRDQVLTKAGATTRVPVVDLAAVLFRGRNFPGGADAQTLEAAFRATFQLKDDDYDKLFVFVDEDSAQIFQANAPKDGYKDSIEEALVSVDPKAPAPIQATTNEPLEADDPVLLQVEELVQLGTSGIILTGPPGTGKSYYANRTAQALTATPEQDVFRVQFHPSYGYEDFVEGYSPDEKATSGFKIVDKVFLDACARARAINTLVVFVIDEINRGDPARVFGELLTYIERGYREETFRLPFSGKAAAIPANLLLIGTMNPQDRSVSYVDAAFVRRFDQIEMTPSREVVEGLLENGGGFDPEQVHLIGEWFERAQNLVPYGLGHSFFADVVSIDRLKLVWRYRIKPTAATAVELNEGKLADLSASFDALIGRLEGQVGAA
jgi:MoxR-like ATPase